MKSEKQKFYESDWCENFDISFFTDDAENINKNQITFKKNITYPYRIEKANNSLAFDISIHNSLNIENRYKKIEKSKYLILKKDIFHYTLIGDTKKVKLYVQLIQK